MSVGLEGVVASRALVSALQQLQFSVTNMPATSDLQFEPGVEFMTDSVPQSAATIQSHNEHNPNHLLPTDRHYALQYTGLYFLPRDEKAFAFKLQAKLWHKGEGGNWRKYKSDNYSAQYFVNFLQAQLTNQFARLNR